MADNQVLVPVTNFIDEPLVLAVDKGIAALDEPQTSSNPVARMLGTGTEAGVQLDPDSLPEHSSELFEESLQKVHGVSEAGMVWDFLNRFHDIFVAPGAYLGVAPIG
jgi:hypothetical protein